MNLLRDSFFFVSALALASCSSSANGSSSGAGGSGATVGSSSSSGTGGFAVASGAGGGSDGATGTSTSGAGGAGGFAPQCGPTKAFQMLLQLGGQTHGMAYADGVVYVTDDATDELVAIDASSDQVLAKIGVGKGPSRVATGKGLVLVLDAQAELPKDPIVSVVDAATRTLVGSVAMPLANGKYGAHPADVAVFDGLGYASLPAFDAPSVVPIELNGFQTTGSFKAGSAPRGIAGSNGYLFVVDLGDLGDPSDDAVYVMATNGTYVGAIATGGALRSIVTAPDGRVFVARAASTPGASRVLAIDPTSFNVKEIACGDGPSGIAVQGSRVYVANESGPSVTVVDTANGDATSTIDLAQAPVKLEHLAGIAVAPCAKIYLEASGVVAVVQAGP